MLTPSALATTLALASISSAAPPDEAGVFCMNRDIVAVTGPVPGPEIQDFQSIAAFGSYIYAASRQSVRTVDVSDPRSPAIVNALPLDNFVGTVDRLGTTLVGVGSTPDFQGVLYTISLADPAAPSLLASLEIPGFPDEPAIVGNAIVIPLRTQGQFAVVDLSDPSSPAIVSITDTRPVPQSVASKGSKVYIATQEGIVEYDLTTPSAPTPLATSPFIAADLAFYGDLLIATNNSGLAVIDFEAPGGPATIASLPLETSTWASITIDGDRAYCTGSSGMSIVDLSDATNPTLIGRAWASGERHTEVIVQGDLAFVAVREDGLAVIDVARPKLLQILATLPIERDPKYGDGFALISNTDELHVVDLANPASPRIAATLPGLFRRIALNGRIAYSTGSPFQIIDLTNLDQPIITPRTDLPPSSSFEPAVANGFLYDATTFPDRLRIFDLSDPAAPDLKQQLSFPWLRFARGAVAMGDKLVIANDPLAIVDVSVPRSPSLLASIDLDRRPDVEQIAVRGTTLFVDDQSAIKVFDLSDPAQPILLDEYSPRAGAGGLAVIDDLLFVEAAVIDASDPSDLRFAARYVPTRDASFRGIPHAIGNALIFPNPFTVISLADCPDCPADLAPPSPGLSFTDIDAFMHAFTTHSRAADLAAPLGAFTFADITTFLDAFAAGCP